jgi:hypothetical protein
MVFPLYFYCLFVICINWKIELILVINIFPLMLNFEGVEYVILQLHDF